VLCISVDPGAKVPHFLCNLPHLNDRQLAAAVSRT
jgi:hypothetical protein